ncbi:hypothetical protein ACLMJK_004786 [Lecanora helva]
MSLTLTIPKEYGYVLGVATLSTVVACWHSVNTAIFRRKAKVPYPNAYCTHAEAKESKEKYLFNCAQRAHAHYQENHPQMLVGLVIGGLKYPVISATMGAAWCASSVLYTIGYCRKDRTEGKGRVVPGEVASVIEAVMIIMSGVTGYQILMS